MVGAFAMCDLGRVDRNLLLPESSRCANSKFTQFTSCNVLALEKQEVYRWCQETPLIGVGATVAAVSSLTHATVISHDHTVVGPNRLRLFLVFFWGVFL